MLIDIFNPKGYKVIKVNSECTAQWIQSHSQANQLNMLSFTKLSLAASNNGWFVGTSTRSSLKSLPVCQTLWLSWNKVVAIHHSIFTRNISSIISEGFYWIVSFLRRTGYFFRRFLPSSPRMFIWKKFSSIFSLFHLLIYWSNQFIEKRLVLTLGSILELRIAINWASSL